MCTFLVEELACLAGCFLSNLPCEHDRACSL
jgi:hypothetical protein